MAANEVNENIEMLTQPNGGAAAVILRSLTLIFVTTSCASPNKKQVFPPGTLLQKKQNKTKQNLISLASS